jgi:hypothetical protein
MIQAHPKSMNDDLGFASLPASYGEHNIVDNSPMGMISSSLIREKTVARIDGELYYYVSPMTGWCRIRWGAVAMIVYVLELDIMLL